MLVVLWLLLGFGVGILLNGLGTFLPQKRLQPALAKPFASYLGWPQGWQGWAVVGLTAVLFTPLPLLFIHWPTLLLNSLYIALLILVIIIDLKHKLIFNEVTYTGTAVALLGSFVVEDNGIWLALAGAAVGFLIFFIIYTIGTRLFGTGAMGFGDVKLAMMMGAMLGFHRIFFALVLGIVLGGLISLMLLLTRLVSRNTALPYGQYLAIAGIVMLVWGQQILDWYLG
ncbi:MAG: A24 family peptidase [Chloroflexota bacterium]